jgi:asparagine synthase (glutamine-hydrolysing)
VLDLDLQTYLVSVLQRQDRMSMAAGVESRVPFLDHEFVEMAVRVPVSRLFEHGRGKAPLRRMARNIIPDEVIQRPKIGFQVPISQWMKQDRGLGRLLAWLCDDQAQDRKIWEAEQVRSLIQAHRRGTADNSDILWSLLALEIWARLWLDGTDHHTLREQILRSVEQKA